MRKRAPKSSQHFSSFFWPRICDRHVKKQPRPHAPILPISSNSRCQLRTTIQQHMHLMAKVGVVETFGQNINLKLSGQTSATGANEKDKQIPQRGKYDCYNRIWNALLTKLFHVFLTIYKPKEEVPRNF